MDTNMADNPFFSVIIPTYNRAALVREAIQSVLDQTFGNFELIIVDDHSTDNTEDIVQGYSDKRISYVLNDHKKGPGGARNAGLSRSRGKWVAFLDSDDVWLPKKLELVYKKTQEVDANVGLLYTGFAWYDFDEKREESLVIPTKEGWIQNDLLYRNCIGTTSAVTIRSDLLRKVAGFDEEMFMGEDFELYVRIAGISKIVYIKDVLTHYRQSNADRLSSQTAKHTFSYLLFWEKHKNLINKNYRLRHRAASRVFFAAVIQGNIAFVFKLLPWTFAGIIFDFNNFVYTCRKILSFFYRKSLSIIGK
jgi:glycosyltransferase involved in cell wall biosynthesis